MTDTIILVDEKDQEIGFHEKLNAHINGKLHRAFSLVVYDNCSNSMLLQQRALNKYHSGGLWTNACCSHPRKGEELQLAVLRRAQEELGINIPQKDINEKKIFEIGKFKYYKNFGNITEHEIDHVFVWFTSKNNSIFPNYNEVNAIQWIDINKLETWMKTSPNDFTAWFFDVYSLFNDLLKQ